MAESIAEQFGLYDLGSVPRWPGPTWLTPTYADGWTAFARYYSATLLALDDERDAGPLHVGADPANHVPAGLSDPEWSAWTVGWLDHVAAISAVNAALRRGETRTTALRRIADRAVARSRQRYL